MEKFINEQKILINSINFENVEEKYPIISKNINTVLENIILRLGKINTNKSFEFLDIFRNIQDSNDCVEIDSIKNYYLEILGLLVLKYGEDCDVINV